MKDPAMHRKVKKRYGSRLADGKAHIEQHEGASRRAFLRNTGLFSLGAIATINGQALSHLLPNPLTRALAADDTDRILVLIRMDGGNDGLNTVVERGNDEYYNIRPTLAIPDNELWALSAEIGMPTTTSALQALWEAGRMKVIHNVGYPQPNYSHFRSSDIWASASDSETVVNTGWIGRAMEAQFDSYLATPPAVPPAIQIGIENNLIFAGAQSNMSLSISNPTEFYRIAQQGQLYDTSRLDDCPSDSELKYARQTANNAFRYSTTIQEAYQRGVTQAEYPATNLAEQLGIVARLIKGQLGTKVYMVTIGGFDTHGTQADSHPELMQELAEAVKAFMDDLDADNQGDRVLGMTFSEFGRTIYENASLGTDHGTGGPVLLFGGADMGNGFVGTPPDLINTGQFGDPDFDIDFRSVYGSVLSSWFGLDGRTTDFILDDQDPLTGLVPEAMVPNGLNANTALLGYRPAGVPGQIDVKYALVTGGVTQLNLLHLNGRPYRSLLEEFKERGSFTFSLDPVAQEVEAGSYLLELRTGGRILRRIMRVA